jgi:SAM-dependent methyltransferase
MTPECQQWISSAVQNYPEMSGKVLEVGAFDVNGNPRGHFSDSSRFPSYTGVDMRAGPNVDLVMNAQDLHFADATFDVIVDAERMEHDDKFWKSCAEEFRVLKPGGYIVVTTRSWNGFPPHDHPSDYWRFMDHGIEALLTSSGFEVLSMAYGENSQAIFALGRKPEGPEPAV